MNDDNLSDTATVVLPFKPRIVTPEVTADAEIVKLLEDLLRAAKRGDIKFLAIATVDGKGVAASTWVPDKTDSALVTQALGSVAFLNHRFNSAADDGGTWTDEFSKPD
jgi:hypothetical protein